MADVIKVRPKAVTPELAASVAGKGTIQGNRVLDWWRTQNNQLQARFAQSVRQSMTHGETLQQAVTRVVGGTVAGVKVKGIMSVSRAQASALVATSMNHATNQARLATYRKNTGIVKQIQQVSTLDNRTSEVCIAYSGLIWDADTLEPVGHELPFNGGPPRHFNCRSTLVPITKSFRELGVDMDEVPKGERASMDGTVPADITFDEWLRGKPGDFQDELLGVEKAALWREQRITLQQLVDFRGNPVPVSELKTLLAVDAPAAAAMVAPSLEAQYAKVWMADMLAVADKGNHMRLSNPQYKQARMDYEAQWEPLIRDMDARQRSAIREYAATSFGEVNAHLRGIREGSKTIVEDVSLIQKAMREMPPMEADTVVFRGMRSAPPEFSNARPGDVLETSGFLSTLGAARLGHDFATIDTWQSSKLGDQTGTILEVVLPKGSTGVLRGFNGNKVEYLLDHRVDLQVVSVRMEQDVTFPDKQIRIIRMVYLGQ